MESDIQGAMESIKWENYENRLVQFYLAIAQAEWSLYVGKEVFDDFPHNLPSQIQEVLPQIEAECKKMTSLEQYRKLWPKIEQRFATTNILKPFLALHKCLWKLGVPGIDNVSFERALHNQTLVMLFAHLDAFMGDSLRTVCKVCPQQLERDKQIPWKAVIKCGSWEKLIDRLIDEYVYKIGMQSSIAERVELIFPKELGIKLDHSLNTRGLLLYLRIMGAARDIIVHNGGIVNQTFIEKTGGGGLTIGLPFRISLKELKMTAQAVRSVASELFVEISKKFFDVPEVRLQEYMWYKVRGSKSEKKSKDGR